MINVNSPIKSMKEAFKIGKTDVNNNDSSQQSLETCKNVNNKTQDLLLQLSAMQDNLKGSSEEDITKMISSLRNQILLMDNDLKSEKDSGMSSMLSIFTDFASSEINKVDESKITAMTSSGVIEIDKDQEKSIKSESNVNNETHNTDDKEKTNLFDKASNKFGSLFNIHIGIHKDRQSVEYNQGIEKIEYPNGNISAIDDNDENLITKTDLNLLEINASQISSRSQQNEAIISRTMQFISPEVEKSDVISKSLKKNTKAVAAYNEFANFALSAIKADGNAEKVMSNPKEVKILEEKLRQFLILASSSDNKSSSSLRFTELLTSNNKKNLLQGLFLSDAEKMELKNLQQWESVSKKIDDISKHMQENVNTSSVSVLKKFNSINPEFTLKKELKNDPKAISAFNEFNASMKQEIKILENLFVMQERNELVDEYKAAYSNCIEKSIGSLFVVQNSFNNDKDIFKSYEKSEQSLKAKFNAIEYAINEFETNMKSNIDPSDKNALNDIDQSVKGFKEKLAKQSMKALSETIDHQNAKIASFKNNGIEKTRNPIADIFSSSSTERLNHRASVAGLMIMKNAQMRAEMREMISDLNIDPLALSSLVKNDIRKEKETTVKIGNLFECNARVLNKKYQPLLSRALGFGKGMMGQMKGFMKTSMLMAGVGSMAFGIASAATAATVSTGGIGLIVVGIALVGFVIGKIGMDYYQEIKKNKEKALIEDKVTSMVSSHIENIKNVENQMSEHIKSLHTGLDMGDSRAIKNDLYAIKDMSSSSLFANYYINIQEAEEVLSGEAEVVR